MKKNLVVWFVILSSLMSLAMSGYLFYKMTHYPTESSEVFFNDKVTYTS